MKQTIEIYELAELLMQSENLEASAIILRDYAEKCYQEGAVSSRTFEYRVIDHDMFNEEEIRIMNSMGSEGWEIIKIFERMKWLNSDGMFVRIYYKRDKQS